MIRKVEFKPRGHTALLPMRAWTSLSLENRSREGKFCVYFPNLEWLVLDTRAWKLREDYFIVVFYSLASPTIMPAHGFTDKPFLSYLDSTVYRDVQNLVGFKDADFAWHSESEKCRGAQVRSS